MEFFPFRIIKAGCQLSIENECQLSIESECMALCLGCMRLCNSTIMNITRSIYQYFFLGGGEGVGGYYLHLGLRTADPFYETNKTAVCVPFCLKLKKRKRIINWARVVIFSPAGCIGSFMH